MDAEDYCKRTFTKKGRKRFKREAIMTPQDIENMQVQARCRYPVSQGQCDNPMQWMNGYCDEHNALLRSQIEKPTAEAPEPQDNPD